MKIKGITITHHAIEQFRKRLIRAFPDDQCKDPEKLFQKLFLKAEKKSINLNSYMNRLERHGKDAEYYITKCGWRFVVVTNEDGEKSLVTVERVNRSQN